MVTAVHTVRLDYLKNRSQYREEIVKQWSLKKSNSCGSSGSWNDSNLLRLFLTRVQFLKLPFLGNLWPILSGFCGQKVDQDVIFDLNVAEFSGGFVFVAWSTVLAQNLLIRACYRQSQHI